MGSYSEKAAGSEDGSSSLSWCNDHAGVAQLVEHQPSKLGANSLRRFESCHPLHKLVGLITRKVSANHPGDSVIHAVLTATTKRGKSPHVESPEIHGSVAERLKAPVLKTGGSERGP